MTTFVGLTTTPEPGAARKETLAGVEYTVVPCVALVEGVLQPSNASGPELALATEFGRLPEAWNGRPLIMNHPTNTDGVALSANIPSVLESSAFGQIYNTILDGDKLKTELWINDARVTSLGGDVKQSVDRLLGGEEVVEVSVGIYVARELSAGTYKGQEYSIIWRDVVPDHLAILSEGSIGACSNAMGCGAPRINSGGGDQQGDQQNGSGATQDGPRAYYINCGCTPTNASEGDKKPIFQRIRELLGDKGTMEFNLATNNENISDGDVRTALYAALDQRDIDGYIIAIFHNDTGSGNVVYEIWSGSIYEQGFTVTDEIVTLSESRQQVRPITKFVPMPPATPTPTEATAMALNKAQLVDVIINSEHNGFEESDRPQLEGYELAKLEKFVPTQKDDAPSTPTTATGQNPAQEPAPPSGAQAPAAAPPAEQPTGTSSVLTQSQLNALAFVEGRAEEHRQGVIQRVLSAKGQYTEEELNNMNLSELNKLCSLLGTAQSPASGVQVHSFIGNGLGAGIEEPQNDTIPVPDVLGTLNPQPVQH